MELRDTAPATDGYPLAVTRFMAENGVHVLTFDYPGEGAAHGRRPSDP
jgi:predicted alpha/beta hydrolase